MLFDVGIMAVTLDLSEYHMFCGGMDGSIFQVDLCTWVSVWGCRCALSPRATVTSPLGMV